MKEKRTTKKDKHAFEKYVHMYNVEVLNSFNLNES